MPFTVRVRNFQSIKDATLHVAGLTVITGPNNSGKTSVLRAIRGAFVNAPVGPLVRQGEGCLTVDLSFEDGQTVTWEKGHEKPDGKGKAVNRYTVNGKVLDGVGRGAPPEVETLGVREISGGLWPQIAKQFDGTLFLVDKPGSVVAEALSDVERVGKLSDALRASESDRRQLAAEIKIRRADESILQDRLRQFDGFDPVLKDMDSLSLNALRAQADLLACLKGLATKLRIARENLARYDRSSDVSIPTDTLSGQFEALTDAQALRDRLESTRKESQGYNLHVKAPFFAFDVSGLVGLQRLVRLRDAALKNAAWPKSFPPVPDFDKLDRYGRGIAKVRDWQGRREGLNQEIRVIDVTLAQTRVLYESAMHEAHSALHEIGHCPTCGTGT